MVSPTSQTRSIRERKHRKAGRKRKNTLENKGSTRSQEELFGDKLPEDAPAQK